MTWKDLDQGVEPSSKEKRRRMLQFKSEGLEAPFCSEEFLKSKVDAKLYSSFENLFYFIFLIHGKK